MATLSVYQYFDLPGVIRGGSKSAPVSITVDGQFDEKNKSLAASTIWNVWTTGADEALLDWDFIWVATDHAIDLELTCDKGNEVGTVVFAKRIASGEPFLLLRDDALAIYTANWGSGTLDVIDRIRIKNTAGGTAIITVILVT